MEEGQCFSFSLTNANVISFAFLVTLGIALTAITFEIQWSKSSLHKYLKNVLMYNNEFCEFDHSLLSVAITCNKMVPVPCHETAYLRVCLAVEFYNSLDLKDCNLAE